MREVASHYFSESQPNSGERGQLDLSIQGHDLRFQVGQGVFSNTRLDPGTAVLLDNAPLPPAEGELLDLGCGYGPIALALATHSRKARVWAVDVNNLALELTGENARANGLANVVAVRPDDLPADIRFDAIYSNPPIRIGKKVLHEMLWQWLPRLRPGGHAYLVVQKNLGSDSLMAWLNAEGFATTRRASRAGYRVLAVDADQSSAILGSAK